MLNTLNITPYPKFEINPIVSQSVNGLVSGFNKMSEFSKNSYENANKTFYDGQSAYEGLNKNLYTTSQDLYGKTYFQKGGIKEEYENIRSLYDTFNSVGETDLASIYSDQLQRLEPEYQKLTLDQYAEQQRTIEDLNSKVRFLENQSYQDTPLIPYSQKYPDYEESTQEGYSPSYAPPLNIGFNKVNLSKNQQFIKEYLGSKGLSRNAIAGIMANIEYESSFNPGIAGDKGMSHGLFQHYNERKNNLLSYLKRNNLPYNDINGQIDFALLEKPEIVRQINLSKTPQEAADIWVRKFEIPANLEKQSQLRQRSSLKYFQKGGLKKEGIGPDGIYYTRDVNNPIYQAKIRGYDDKYNDLSRRFYETDTEYYKNNRDKVLDNLKSFGLRNSNIDINETYDADTDLNGIPETYKKHSPVKDYLKTLPGYNKNVLKGYGLKDLRSLSEMSKFVTENEAVLKPFVSFDNNLESYNTGNVEINYPNKTVNYSENLTYPFYKLPEVARINDEIDRLNLYRSNTDKTNYNPNIQGYPVSYPRTTTSISFKDDPQPINRDNLSALSSQRYPINNNKPSIQAQNFNVPQQSIPKSNQSLQSLELPNYNNRSKPSVQGIPITYSPPVLPTQSTSINTLGSLSFSNPTLPQSRPNIVGQTFNIPQQPEPIDNSPKTPLDIYDRRGKFLRQEMIRRDDHGYVGRHRYAPRGKNGYIDVSAPINYQKGGYICNSDWELI